jgi:hypothetical protein
MKDKIKMIPCIDARDLPVEVLNWLSEEEIQTHYQNDVAIIVDDGNPFAEWLKSCGVELSKEHNNYIAILST